MIKNDGLLRLVGLRIVPVPSGISTMSVWIGKGLAYCIDILVWDWPSGSIDWRLSGTALRMDSLNHPPLRHFGWSRIVLVPLTKWGIVHWIGPSLTCLVPIECQLSSIYSLVQV